MVSLVGTQPNRMAHQENFWMLRSCGLLAGSHRSLCVKASPGRTNGFLQTTSDERRESHDATYSGRLLRVDYACAAMKLKLRFDNESDTPAHFSAFYLLGKDEHELIRLLNQ